MIARPATYIGLRTWRYSPPTTRRLGAATGTGVPKPSTTKRVNAWTITISPAASRTAPSTRTGAKYGTGSCTRQPVSNHGIRPAKTPGPTTKNTALPTAAVCLRILKPHLRSVVEDRQVELAQARGVGEYVDLDNLPARDREAHDRKRLSPWSCDESRGSVHECRSCKGGKPREGERLLGHRPRAADLLRCACRQGTDIGSEHDVWVEHREQRLEVTLT